MSQPLNVSDLEFEGIKENLKAWMRNNPEFTDYDFEASGLSFLLDTLAYNTHYNAVLASLMANEMFLDTSIKRSSVLSHAKSLGYRPKGVSAARAKINITINAVSGGASPSQFILRRGTAFNATIANQYYQFVTIRDYVAINDGGTFQFNNVEIYEGIFNTYVWKLEDDIAYKYKIPNVRVDTNTIKMHLYASTNATDYEEWHKASNAINVIETSKVFFTQETENNYTEFYFGNGIVGSRPSEASIIKVEYVSTNGAEGNGAKTFSPAVVLSHDTGSIVASNFTITMVEQSQGGMNAESIDNIKYHASNHFAVQNRAVTTNDYVALIREGFSNVEDIKVWGGEESAQKQYGVVFVCIKPEVGSFITQKDKEYITSILKSRSVMGTKIRFVDPEYIDVVVNTRIKYNIDRRDTGIDLEGIVRDEILRYSDNMLESFNKPFKHSNLIRTIDDTHGSIVSNITSVLLYKSQTPIIGLYKNYTLKFHNELKRDDGAIESSLFIAPEHSDFVKLLNRGSIMVMGYYNQTGKFVVIKDVGTVDYANGIVQLNNINVLRYEGDETYLLAKPASNDIYPFENNVLRIRPQNVSVATELEID